MNLSSVGDSRHAIKTQVVNVIFAGREVTRCTWMIITLFSINDHAASKIKAMPGQTSNFGMPILACTSTAAK
jgi:hypothetical protein